MIKAPTNSLCNLVRMDMTALSTKAVTSSLGTSAKLTTVPVSDSALCYSEEKQKQYYHTKGQNTEQQ